MNYNFVKKYKFTILAFSILLAYFLYPSKYDRLIKPIEDIKMKEVKNGVPNPVYDGVREPDFPDRSLNNSTFEGIDSNGDGVRDDVEIWINRTAEDESIRKSKKDVYRAYFNILTAVKESQPEKEVHERVVDFLQELECHSYTMWPLEDHYYKKYGYNGSIHYSKALEAFFESTSIRQSALSRFNSYNFSDTLGVRDHKFCQKKSYANQIRINIEKRNKEESEKIESFGI
jgi:hypothetical protein